MKSRLKTELIKYYIFKNKLTKKAFCEKCGISTYALNKLLKHDYSVGISAVFKIAKVIDIELYLMFESN